MQKKHFVRTTLNGGFLPVWLHRETRLATQWAFNPWVGTDPSPRPSSGLLTIGLLFILVVISEGFWIRQLHSLIPDSRTWVLEATAFLNKFVLLCSSFSFSCSFCISKRSYSVFARMSTWIQKFFSRKIIMGSNDPFFISKGDVKLELGMWSWN